MGHIYNGILLSHKKKRNWVICSEVDGLRVCHTEWSKSERESKYGKLLTFGESEWNINGFIELFFQLFYIFSIFQNKKLGTDE